MGWRQFAAALAVMIIMVLASPGPAASTTVAPNATALCPHQHLVVCDTEQLGVTHVQLLGRVRNVTVLLQAFVRIVRSHQGNLTMFGIGWLEGELLDEFVPGHRDWQQQLPNASLVAMHPSWAEAGWSAPVRFSHPPKDDEPMKNFRMDAAAQLPAHLHHVHFFQLRLEGWQRRFPLDVHRHAAHGLLLPWHAMASAHDHPPNVEPGGGHGTNALPPLVVAVALSATPGPDAEQRIWHQAQALIRHAEYHLGQLKMQRMLVYAHAFVFNAVGFRDYLSRHMPPHLVPFVTFVLWQHFPVHLSAWVWQIPMYYHATVMLWGYGGARVANIDLDEYIAFPGPPATLHEALERCDPGQELDVILLFNEFHVCRTCVDSYAKSKRAETHVWAALEAPLTKTLRRIPSPPSPPLPPPAPPPTQRLRRRLLDVGGTQPDPWPCRWNIGDPLKLYSRRWNDKWYANSKMTRADRLRDTMPTWANPGKLMVRPEGVLAYNMHRANALNASRLAVLDSDRCPYVAHLVHLFGYRASRHGGDLALYKDPAVSSNWWITADGAV